MQSLRRLDFILFSNSIKGKTGDVLYIEISILFVLVKGSVGLLCYEQCLYKEVSEKNI